jgi:DNA-binding MarR family transcriptional regulator
VTSRYEDSILRSLRRIARSVDLHSRQLARKHELTGPQLVCLRQIQREAITTPSALARAIHLSQGTVTGILDRLEGRNLVSRERSRHDKRHVLLRLTETGEELVARAPSPLHEQLSGRLAALPEGEQASIDWILQRLVTLMEADAEDVAPMLASGPALAGPQAVADFLEPEPEPEHEPDAQSEPPGKTDPDRQP